MTTLAGLHGNIRDTDQIQQEGCNQENEKEKKKLQALKTQTNITQEKTQSQSIILV